MRKYYLAIVGMFVCATFANAALIDDVEFWADSVISSGGSLSTEPAAASIDDAVLGGNMNTFARLAQDATPGYVELGFAGGILNVDSVDDLALFEIGILEDFELTLTVGDTTQTVVVSASGDTNSAGLSINTASVDLSDFGVAVGDYIESIVIQAPVGSPATWLGPDLAAAGSLHPRAVPEPGTLAIWGLLSTLGLVAIRRRK
jgi:hypothetical protein